ncbi:activating transcription factor 7-interacting protein 1 [Gouania willdenowi]|uniref:activating transcription factor 7-interacting protein 1 n=1 Tax=Gouania willdenowi TaxID=441366 RepID=UPI0010554BA7|nr:activating transcription factor 7-interacting protein 1-like [Gouania willdenowi]
MEVLVTEEKKKIFRARKTMKTSDRQHLESVHNTLLTATPGLSNPSPPPLLNGTHKEDEQKAGDKEPNISDSNSPCDPSPASPTSLNSPAPFLSLNLSPSTSASQSPNVLDEVVSPTSPFHTLNFELKKIEKEKNDCSPSPPTTSVTLVPTDCKEQKEKDTEVVQEVEKDDEKLTTKDSNDVLEKKSAEDLPETTPENEYTSPMEMDKEINEDPDPEPCTGEMNDTDLSSTKLSISNPPSPCNPTVETKDNIQIKEQVKKDSVKKKMINEENMEVMVQPKTEKPEAGQVTKLSRPSSTPPSTTVKEEKSSTSRLKRALSEGYEKDGQNVKREGKRIKMDQEELEAQLEVKITAKAGNDPKLEKLLQQLVDERLKVLEVTIFNKHFQELKERIDKIDCATKHQAAINTLQAKIARIAKKFGEANQASENKRKQEALAAASAAAAAAAAAAASAAAATVTATAAKATTVTISPQPQRQVRTSMEVKQTPTLVPSSTSAVMASPLAPPPVATAAPSSSTAVVSKAPILQLITSTSNAVSNLATGITTQSPTGTLVLKTAPGSSVMTAGQPLLIQLPLSMNGQTGTVVNIPVSSLSAASSLNKSKTTTSTTFIFKPAPITTTAHGSTSISVPSLQASTSQMSPAQLSLARTVFQGGAGGITTPNAGVSVTTVRSPAQSVSVVGALSSASSPAASGPAATGSTAPGPPQGISLTSKTDNQATGTTPSKAAAPVVRPKGSVIDLTEDDDDVQVTGVKKATIPTPSPAARANTAISTPNSTGARSSPQSSQNSVNPQLTVHHRPPLDSPLKTRPVNGAAPTRVTSVTLPPLPTAPAAPRLPPEADRTSPPQQPQLKLVPSQTGIVLSWCVAETDRTCAAVDSYHLYAFHQDNSSSSAAQHHWKKIGEVKALPLPMACTLTQFQSGSTYHFAVRAKDIYGRFGSFCEPQCTNVVSSSSS